ncbi:enoyl-CoA hydratase-related protein [Ornithinimicrobium cavernae]|uniref:enoyl-CoA hydratase-related protein n=1 Tax=Ornithinimicrobium cavernae TaxID=2666047 RepID=UPI00192A315D|nr:enoyl-CoA hydratase-related protein [Ornithinimicrobium cavernae]
MADEVLVEVDGRGVATVTLNRPEVNNAYDEAMLRGVHAAIDAALASQDTEQPVRCVVVRGEGRHFQAGADLRWLTAVQQGNPQENFEGSELTGSAVRRLTELDVPVVALVQGACFGGGTGILAAADVVVCGEDSVFSIAEVKWGLHASVILPQLADAIGPRQVRRYALTGERFDAAEARRIGLVHEVVAREDVPARGAEIVDAILSSGPGGVATTKRLARGLSWSSIDDDQFTDLVQEHSDGRQADEAREGLTAFREKRSPAWVPAADGS